MTQNTDDRPSVKAWLSAWADAIANNDIERGRNLFDASASGFGTITFCTRGLVDLVDRQWTQVWARTKNFTFETDDQVITLSDDSCLAVVQTIWNSSRLKGDTSLRRGRATIVLKRTDSAAPWLGVHTHFSMWPTGADTTLGTPIS